ncbi:uncharacterized protein KY384_005729 [Bacidia gigantensis]|uniref:uncharacterized protein n=1 Tax=Bacidia gigantensis TaxID=2732470 RepID=UPI001D04D7DA|nr:uncharacterized protein KY384_005729 [Bacidia gigantensis]KAG8529094.1 hypothetical protein KY384_005729 [Bacidia gigantensis]
MPRQKGVEKSPVAEDYEGLQVDPRPKPEKSPYGFHFDEDEHIKYKSEKQVEGGVVTVVRGGPGDPMSPQTAYAYGSTTLSPETPSWARPWDARSRAPSSPVIRERDRRKDRRICWLHRSTFWVLLVIIILLLVGGAVVGGIFGGMKAKNKGSSDAQSAPPPPTPSGPVFPQAHDPSKRQEFRLYFQSLLGNVKEAVSTGSSSWQSAKQGSLFYVGTNGLLQEKRKIYSDNQFWEPGKLNSLNVAMVGNISLPAQGSDPQDSWHSYAMTAVYARNTSIGPSAHLFYHAQQTDGSNSVKEMIWVQANDTWLEGDTITDAYPNSHLAATVDDRYGILRLFYATGNSTLQEAWTSLSDKPKNGYKKGMLCTQPRSDPQHLPPVTHPLTSMYAIAGLRLPNFLYGNSADLAAVSQNGTTYLYHYASAKQSASVGIHELVITGSPSLGTNQESFNATEGIVAAPSYPAGTNASMYQPLTAGKTVVPGLKNQLLVLWADKPTGDPNTNSTGYGELGQISRGMTDKTWPTTGALQVPLGSSNSDPH